MCRIAGIINPSLSIDALGQMVKEMCDLQKHGGPDDEGIYADAERRMVLGHRRLALIDLSAAGHQPMSYAQGRYQITYNGELYNYIEIKEELVQAGYLFTTNSDTEVILAAFAAWGTHVFKRFNGMFAFALWDHETGCIYLVRDASGIKPLYYAVTAEGLAFASEIRAFASVDYLQEENPDWRVFLLAYGHLPEPVTTLKQVKPLPKGCFLRYYCGTAKWDIEAFSFYNYHEQDGDREAAKTNIKATLEQAVKRHLISDAPIGVFLSGGIDSSIMTILAHKNQRAGLKTLSIDFVDTHYSEKKYQNLITNQLDCPNWQHILTEREFHHSFPNIIKAMDMPGCDGLNTWYISKYAKESGLKAVLSGIGGDELFGGYPSFRRMALVNLIKKNPASLLRAGRYSNNKKIRRLAYLSLEGAKGSYLFLRGQFVPATIARQLNMDEKEVWRILDEQPELLPINKLSAGNQASWIELNMYMQNQLLRDSDVMSMSHGIEIRVPFLDKEVVELALNIQSPVKYGGQLPKQLLIDSFAEELPEAIWNRPKMGFSFPFAEWLGKNDYVKEAMLGSGAQRNANYEKFRAGQMHWSQLMSLMLLGKRG